MSKLDDALKAVDQLFGDTSVSPYETFERLGELHDHVEMLMDAAANNIPNDSAEDEDWDFTDHDPLGF